MGKVGEDVFQMVTQGVSDIDIRRGTELS